MLTKKQAKTFFVGGTILFSGVFLWLTVDTVNDVRKRHSNITLTPEIVRGKYIWEDNNCMGCHTLLGEGGYYAPELTLVYERRGPEFIKAMLRDPESMYPGQRKMQKYDLTEEEISSLVAFFKWIGEMDLNGFPPRNQILNVAVPEGSEAVASEITQPKIFSQMCVACHSIGGQGGVVGPALDDIGHRKSREDLIVWLTDPQKVKPGTLMPKMPLSEEDIAELAAYLTTLKKNTEK